MVTRYATGRRAWGYCARSGKRMLLRDMVVDGQTGLLVAPEEFDPKHPQEIPIDVTDPQALARPAPNLDESVTIADDAVRWGDSESDFPGY